MYSADQVNHIIYNNRSYEGVVKNFIPDLKINELSLLLEIENQLKFINKLVDNKSSIIIDKNKLDLNEKDVELYPDELENIRLITGNFNQEELNLLKKKNIPNHIIEKYNFCSLSQITDLKILNLIGVTSHPILKRLIGDGLSSGILIPLYNQEKLINTVFRKTNDITKLKYGISVPSIDFWGNEILENEELWICEGLFDMMALRDEGKRCISASSCSLSSYQYFKIVYKRPSIVNIFTDNDTSGYISSLRSQKLFGLNSIPSRIFSSKKAKDPAEHFFELKLDWTEVEEILITPEMVTRKDDMFDFLEYLENRKF